MTPVVDAVVAAGVGDAASGRVRDGEAEPAVDVAFVWSLVGRGRQCRELRLVAGDDTGRDRSTVPWNLGCAERGVDETGSIPRRDPNHGLPADYKFHPVLVVECSDDEVRAALRGFAGSVGEGGGGRRARR
jgi:hypothetical protein